MNQVLRLHLEEQLWRHIRDFRGDMKQVVAGITHPDDAALLKGLCSYILIRMELEEIKSAQESLDLLVCHKDLDCSRCENEEECFTLTEKIDELEEA
jgi:hypothetical protein